MKRLQDILRLTIFIHKYQKTKLKRTICEELKEDLDVSSSYSTFKRWIIRDNLILTQQFKQYIGDKT